MEKIITDMNEQYGEGFEGLEEMARGKGLA